jgi:hypothetical protein
MPIIPATEEVKIGGTWTKAGPGKTVRPYLKKKKKTLKDKRTRMENRSHLREGTNGKKRVKERNKEDEYG